MKKPELVTWRDANSDVSEKDWTGEYLIQTLGWTEEEGAWLKIVGERTPDGDRAITRVPLVNVVSRQKLRIKR